MMELSEFDFFWRNILIALLFVVLGLGLMFNQPYFPKKIDPYTGFKISSSVLRNPNTYKEGLNYAGKISSIGGLISIIFGLFLNMIIPFEDISSEKILVVCQHRNVE